MSTKNINRTCLLLAMLGAALPPASKVMAQEAGTVVIDGLNSPMGVLVTPDGSVWVVDTGVGGDTELELLLFGDAEKITDTDTGGLTSWRFGETARVVQLTPEGVKTVVATLPSLIFPADATFNSGGAGLAMIGDQIYVTTGMWWPVGEVERPSGVSAVVRLEEGHGMEVANTWDVERAQNPDGWELATNPYGLASGPDGDLWVADAAANSLLRIDPETGEVTVITVFDGIPGPIPNPDRGGAMETAPVPTGVTFDEDGELYVSLLPGVPFVPGSAKVVKVSQDGTVSDYATGLTMLTDIRGAPDGNLYVVTLAEFTEAGPTPESGEIVRILEDGSSEVVLRGLSFPTSIDFGANGDAYVTINGMGEPGSGKVVRFEGVATEKKSGQ